MPITVKHSKTSAIPDAGDSTLVQPSDWNADHTLTGLGTMAEQNANAVAITGGTISGVTIPASNVTGTLGVANGGTGATTLTGYVKGAGTSAFTASSTIPNTDITGLGTASTKDAGSANGVATLDAGGKVPVSELPAAVLGALSYQGTWNASTNTPTLTSSTGTKGYYYVVSVAGNTNLDGITDWLVGDWAVYNGTVWQKVDNTETVTSVNGQTGAVVLTTTNIAEGTNEYFTTAKARLSVSAGTGISYNNTTGVITNSSPSLGGDVVGPASATDNAIARYDTTTGKLIQNSTATIDDTGTLATSKGLIGSGANFTDYPSAQFVSTQSKISGYGHAYKIGVVGEAQASSSDSNIWGIGVHGRGWTNNATRCAGLEGDAGVTNSADTGTATAIRANSTSTHSGGLNIGVTIDVSGSSVNNYALYMINGNLFSAAAQTWELVDNSNSALVFNTAGKTGILDIITTNGAEGISTSGTLTAIGTTSLGTLGVSGTSTLSNVAITGTTSFDGSQGTNGQVLTSAGTGNTPTWTTPTTGTVTSVDLTASTGISVSGGPITGSGSITVTNTAPDQVVSIASGTGISASGTYPNFTVTNTAPDQTVSISAGTGISVTGTYPSFTVTNTSPDVPFTYTTNYIPYGQGTTTPNQSANLTFDGTTQTAPVQRASNGIVTNNKTIGTSFTIPSTDNAMSSGPVTLSAGVTVTVSSGSRWVVL
jgi:hypothetical protein